MPERVRVALIGAGRIGQRHAATLASAIPRAELAIIADVHGPSAEALAAKVRCQHSTDNPESVLAGALGRIEAIRDTMRDPSPASRAYLETSGGLYRDMTIHNFDCVRWMMGQEVRELFAMGSAIVSPMFRELGDIDTSVISLRFGDDSLGVIDNSRRSGFGYDVRTEVFGSEGALMIGYSRDTPMLRLDANGVHSDHIHWFLERFDQAYIDELKVFVDGIIDGTPPPVDGDDARAAMVLAYAAEASLRENAPVSPSRF